MNRYSPAWFGGGRECQTPETDTLSPDNPPYLVKKYGCRMHRCTVIIPLISPDTPTDGTVWCELPFYIASEGRFRDLYLTKPYGGVFA